MRDYDFGVSCIFALFLGCILSAIVNNGIREEKNNYKSSEKIR